MSSTGTETELRAAARRTALTTLAELDAQSLRPPQALTLSEWADKYRILSPEAAAEPGPWRTDRVPYLRGVLDACVQHGVERVLLLFASQCAKTEVELNLVGYHIDQDPSPILSLQASLEAAQAWSTDRLAPMLRDTPVLRGRVKEAKTRTSANTIRHKVFPGGHITIVGANSAVGLSMRPIRILIVDELDRFPPSAGTEGDPLSLAERRTSTFWNRKIVIASSPTIRGASRVEKEWQGSDQRRYEVPCPACGEKQPLNFHRPDTEEADPKKRGFLHWDEGNPSSVAYLCGYCGHLIDESEKYGMLDAGEWVATNPEGTFPGFHISQLYSPFVRWEGIVREFLKVRATPELLKVFVNTVLGELWEDLAEKVDITTLGRRREDYVRVPYGAAVLTGGVDVQGDRIELEVRAWGAGEESWLIAHHRIYGDPQGRDVWERLETLLVKSYTHENGQPMRIRSCAIDTGHATLAVYAYVRGRQNRGVRAVKGSSERNYPLIGRPPKKPNKHGVKVWPLGTIAAKDRLFARLRIVAPGAGYMHFPQPQQDGADEEYLNQYGGEKVVTRKNKKGVSIREYAETGRNEAIDLYVYNFAALYMLGRAVTDNLGALAARYIPPKDETSQEEPVKQEQELPPGELPKPVEPGPRRMRSHRRGGGWIRGG
jgi:phage terminase large subunit GpA-like protein